MLLQENISLRRYNSFGIETSARYFSSFSGPEELHAMYDALNRKNIHERLILGGGSNILFTKNFDGCVIKNELKGIDLVNETGDAYFVRAYAGENWHSFVMYCIGKQYYGLENLSLIPGNVGASPIQNIGAYGVEIKDFLHQLEAWNTETQEMEIFTNAACKFGYRESVFKNIYKGKYIICSVTFRLLKEPRFIISYGAIEKELEEMGVTALTAKAVSDAVIHIRESKLPDPAIIGNAGSFFKNPVVSSAVYESLKTKYPQIPGYPANEGNTKLAAGWLIEQCGWKGYRKGDAGCFEKQALVLVNYGHASGPDIYQLSQNIINSVFDRFGIILEREVNIY